MSGGLDVVLKRTSESGMFCRPVENLVPVCSEDPVEENRTAQGESGVGVKRQRERL
jgi:hypothetical protein